MRMSCRLFFFSTLPPDMPQGKEESDSKLSLSGVHLMLCVGLCIKTDTGTVLLFSEVHSSFSLYFFTRGNFLFLLMMLPE